MLDARLQDGSRVNVITSPLTLKGPCISIRKFARTVIDFSRLVEIGSVSERVARVLRDCRAMPAQHHHFRRHRIGKDLAPQRALTAHRSWRARHHHRGYRRASIAAAARRAARNTAAQRRGPRAKSRSAISCGTRFGCGRIASSSARSGAGGLRHAAGDEYGSQRLDVDHSREYAARRAQPDREHGDDGQRQPAEPGDQSTDDKRARSYRPGRADAGRRSPRDRNRRGRRHGRGCHHHLAGLHLRLEGERPMAR